MVDPLFVWWNELPLSVRDDIRHFVHLCDRCCDCTNVWNSKCLVEKMNAEAQNVGITFPPPLQ